MEGRQILIEGQGSMSLFLPMGREDGEEWQWEQGEGEAGDWVGRGEGVRTGTRARQESYDKPLTHRTEPREVGLLEANSKPHYPVPCLRSPVQG